MPPLPSPGLVVKARLIGTNQSTIWNAIHHMQYTGTPPTAGSLQSLAASIGTAWNTAIAPICNTSLALTQVVCIDLSSDTGNEGAATVNHLGTRAGALFPASVACVFSWHIPRRYRGGHPRTYVPAGVETDLSAGHLWNTTAQAAFAAAASGFLSNMNAISIGGTPFFMVNVAYRRGGIILATPIVDPITSSSVDDRIDTQRRRLGKPV
jgi:hypothetical protein